MVEDLKQVDSTIGLIANKQIELLDQIVYCSNARHQYNELRKAYDSIETQAWFLYALYDADIYGVFKLFRVPRDLTDISNIVNYNYNPTIPNLKKFLKSVLGVVNWELIIDKLQVTILVDSEGLAIKNNWEDDSSGVLTKIDGTAFEEVDPVVSNYSQQNLYLLVNYVSAGTELIIGNLTNKNRGSKKNAKA